MDRTLVLDSEIAALLQKQAIIRVSSNPGPGILQPHFLSKEGKFILETNHRFIKTEQVHKPGKIQNGDHRVNQSDITAK